MSQKTERVADKISVEQRFSKFRFIVFIFTAGLLNLLYSNCSGTAEEVTDESSLSSSATASCGENLTAAQRSPQTIEQVVSLINLLPKPLTLDCFARSLQKPLQVFAANSPSSVQPAFDSDNPRIFIIYNRLIMAVVPKGSAKYLLEMSYKTSSDSSVKAELLFPIKSNITSSAAFERIRDPSFGTTCRTCHTNEGIYPGVPGGIAFQSKYIAPLSETQITQPYMKAKAMYCNATLDPYRCALLQSIYIQGEAKDAIFP